MSYVVSKTVARKEGCVCQMRGSKLIVAGKRTKHIAGVWTNGGTSIVLQPSGQREIINTPQGLIIYGPAKVLLGK